MKEEKQNQGVTLIALVITIIVLLLLAGISISTLTGQNGILSKSTTAGEETSKKEYEEILKLIGNSLRTDKIMNNWDYKKYLDEFEKEIKKEEKFKESEVNRKDDETIIVITKEGYVYKIIENRVEYIGKQGETEIPKLEESNISFVYNPSPEEQPWTNGKVVVGIFTQTSEYQLQYSLDGKNWKNYEKEIEVQESGAIYARLVNNLYETVCQATGNVTNIDKTQPTSTITFDHTSTDTASSVVATIEQKDNQSGINITECKWIYNTISGNIGTNEEDYIGGNFTTTPEEISLKVQIAGTYYLHVLSIDNVGNKKETVSEAVIVEKIPTVADLTTNNYVNYVDPNGSIIKCAVLWDTNSIYGNRGVQIVAMNTVEQVTFGSGDAWQAMANAYNGAITTLNARASAYLNTTYANNARCIGSVPNNPNSESSEYYKYGLNTSPSIKKEDLNYQADYNQMNSLGITNINTQYWLASRAYWRHVATATYTAGCRYITTRGELFTPKSDVITTSGSETMISITNDGFFGDIWYKAKEQTLGLRPVFTLKLDVKIIGDGTSSNPYILDI
ncbi:MAG: hypothetical protein HFJ33_02250 [Clostridia bacterium]|nr:hypothetical protein [Clostridia bacterium]